MGTAVSIALVLPSFTRQKVGEEESKYLLRFWKAL